MKRPVHIGLDARYAFRANRRGIGEYVAALIRHLPAVAADADRFILYVDHQADLDAVAIDDPRFTVRQLSVANPLLWEEVALPRAARGDGIQLLHLTSNYGPSRPPCPTVYTIHDTIEFLRGSFGRPNLSWRHALGRNIRVRTLPYQARNAQLVITVSETSKRDIQRWLGVPADRIHVIPLGVSEEFRPAPSLNEAFTTLAEAGFHRNVPYILALGALDPRKNGSMLIRAFERVYEARPEYELRIVGIENPDAYPLPILPKPSWLHLSGFVPRATLVALMQAATIFVYPSLYEGFGLPPLQAMACGTPVIVSDHPAIAEAVEDGAIRASASNLHGLAGRILQLLEDEGLRHSLAGSGMIRAMRFRWRETARKTYAAYRTALRAAQGSAA
jgi:glycosyltransferase involved in cell wall biosynthesis